MKLGLIDITKAYFGLHELDSTNAYLGEVPLIEGVHVDKFRFVAMANNSSVKLATSGTSFTNIEYSMDGDSWSALTLNTPVTLNSGDTMYVHAKQVSNADTDGSQRIRFATTGTLAIKGNMNCLIDYTNPDLTTIPYNNSCRAMFLDNTAIVDASELKFPATTLSNSCYRSMFQGCTNLASVPSIMPATTLAVECYYNMFNGCPFTTAPELPATTLKTDCYRSMFWGCTNLTTAPELKAKTMINRCYESMFNGCSSLNYIKCLATSYVSTSNSFAWVDGVSATGTFVKDISAYWTTGKSGIPNGWTVEDAS